MRIELDRVLEILDRRVAVVRSKRAENESAEIVAAAKVFFPRLVRCRSSGGRAFPAS